MAVSAVGMLDTMLELLLTRDNPAQIDWLKKYVAVDDPAPREEASRCARSSLAAKGSARACSATT